MAVSGAAGTDVVDVATLLALSVDVGKALMAAVSASVDVLI